MLNGIRAEIQRAKRAPDLGRKKNSLILGGTKRAADLGRNGPRTLDLDEKKQPISGGTFREWDLGPKLKIHVFDGFCKINSGSFNPDLRRKTNQPISTAGRTLFLVLLAACSPTIQAAQAHPQNMQTNDINFNMC